MLPKKYLQRIESFLDKSDLEQTIKGYTENRVCSFRVNTLKSSQEEVESFLCSQSIAFTKAPFLSLAYIIDKKDEFTLKGSDFFYEGKIYVQGLTSQIPAILLDLQKDMRVFDITAAPGSKTTQMSAIMENTGLIVACEKHQIRYYKLMHNIKLQGTTNIESRKVDAEKLMSELQKESFDAILLDAPCSAEGRFKLDNERSYGFWTLTNIREKALIQTTLLEASIPLLKKGGVLVYSTCTLAPEENEGVINAVLAKHPDLKLEKIELPEMPFVRTGIMSFEGSVYNSSLENTVRILPSHMTEGFYLAKIRKM